MIFGDTKIKKQVITSFCVILKLVSFYILLTVTASLYNSNE
jgi:hypothetical protein